MIVVAVQSILLPVIIQFDCTVVLLVIIVIGCMCHCHYEFQNEESARLMATKLSSHVKKKQKRALTSTLSTVLTNQPM